MSKMILLVYATTLNDWQRMLAMVFGEVSERRVAEPRLCKVYPRLTEVAGMGFEWLHPPRSSHSNEIALPPNCGSGGSIRWETAIIYFLTSFHLIFDNVMHGNFR